MFKLFRKIKTALGTKIGKLFGRGRIDEETLDELEALLYEADLGSTLVQEFTSDVAQIYTTSKDQSAEPYIQCMKDKALRILETRPKVQGAEGSPHVILVVGVNGSGKTTTIAKLAQKYQAMGKSVLLAAGDTFRAAAVEQLQKWGEKLGVPCITGHNDPAAVLFDALTHAKNEGIDIVLADTAGRLESKSQLIDELAKIRKVGSKVIPDSPHDTYLVLDSTIGQNALEQARVFHAATPLTGLILTKLDGSSKGGIVLSIYHELGIPVKYIGVGETADDLLPFDPNSYVDALF